MSTHYVYSTLAADVKYTRYKKQEVVLTPGVAPKVSDVPLIESSVLIKGGAGVSPAGIRRLETPLGVVTAVTDEELDLLENNEVFKTHKENGFMRVRKKEVAPEVVVADDMESRDESAPLTPADMAKAEPEEKEKVKPTKRFDKTILKNTLQ